jgi:hypothetical protein
LILKSKDQHNRAGSVEQSAKMLATSLAITASSEKKQSIIITPRRSNLSGPGCQQSQASVHALLLEDFQSVHSAMDDLPDAKRIPHLE